ncbi:50S ribosomal protein L13 [bacterium]|nr:50S ribosomal protein L13 [candidate division CSSED10-310 bacterium]
MKTTRFAKKEDIRPVWYILDAAQQPVGRIASMAAFILRGKHRPDYTPHVDLGDHIIILNADKIRLTGQKMARKMYYRHSGYLGGMSEINAERLLQNHPDRVMISAVRGMLPKNKLGRKLLKKMKVYAGSDHPHQAQQPTSIEVSGEKFIKVRE